MPFHITTNGQFGGTVYYTGGNRWSSNYADRKVFSLNSEALARKNATISEFSGQITYVPKKWQNATIVSE